MKKKALLLMMVLGGLTNAFGQVPTLLIPSDNAKNQAVDPALDWVGITGSNHYIYKIDTSINFDSPFAIYEKTFNSSSQVTAKDLLYGEKHFWKVAAVNSNDTSGWSATWSFTTSDTMSLDKPSFGAINQSVDPQLDWVGITGTNHYIYKADTSANFDSPDLRIGKTSNSNSVLITSDLLYGEKYYWQVAAVNSNDTSSWTNIWCFTTSDTMSLDKPIFGALNQSVDPQLDWVGISGTNHYIYKADTSANFDSPDLRVGKSSNSNSVLITSDLLYGKKYYWQVAAVNSNDTSTWSDVWCFSTSDTMSLVTPLLGAVDQSVDPQLDWIGISGSNHYIYKADTSANFDSPDLRTGKSPNSNSVLITTDLLYGEKYYWKVAAVNSNDTSTWSNVWNFTTSETLTLIAPAHLATNVGVAPTIDWGGILGSNRYKFQVDTSGDFNSPLLIEGLTSNNSSIKNLSGLLFDERYNWRVAAVNSRDTSIWSDTWSFFTGDFITSINESNFDLAIYPNPTTDKIQINYLGKINSISILDITGKEIKKINSDELIDNYELDLNSMNNGYFLINILTDEGMITRKVIKK